MTYVCINLDTIFHGIIAFVVLVKFIMELADKDKRRPTSKGKRR